MQVVKFTIEESKVNKGKLVLIAHTDSGKKYVVNGENIGKYLTEYEKAFDTK